MKSSTGRGSGSGPGTFGEANGHVQWVRRWIKVSLSSTDWWDWDRRCRWDTGRRWTNFYMAELKFISASEPCLACIK